ncbi:MAG: hypothetical protein AAFN76_03985 [Pseudomonadota bacterium]
MYQGNLGKALAWFDSKMRVGRVKEAPEQEIILLMTVELLGC